MKNVNISFVKDDLGRVEFSLSKRLIIISMTMFFLLSIIVILLSFFVSKNLCDLSELKRLKEENKFLTENMSDLVEKTDFIKSQITKLQSNNKKLAMSADLPDYENIETFGVGGTYVESDNNFQSDDYLEFSPLNGGVLKKLDNELNDLEKVLFFEKSKLNEIETHLTENLEGLKYIPAINPILEDNYYFSKRDFGMHKDPFTGIRRMHNGMDIVAPTGTRLGATADGVVEFVGRKFGYGKTIVIKHNNEIKTLYGHLSYIAVKKGEKVIRGQYIGKVGNTGRSTGPHLHYEVRINNTPVDPIDYILPEVFVSK